MINAQIWIQDSTFNIEKTKYQFTPRALTYYHQFEFEEEYMQWQNRSLPKSRSIQYSIIENQDTILGKTEIQFDNPIQLETSAKMGLEVQTFADDAEKKEDDFGPISDVSPWTRLKPLIKRFAIAYKKNTSVHATNKSEIHCTTTSPSGMSLSMEWGSKTRSKDTVISSIR